MTFTNGPESPFVVDALDSLLRGDLDDARGRLAAGAEAAGWEAVAHRIDVAGRALAVDAGYTPDTIPDEIDLVPEVLATTVSPAEAFAPSVLGGWCDAGSATASTPEGVWASLATLAWLVDQSGYPAEVVV